MINQINLTELNLRLTDIFHSEYVREKNSFRIHHKCKFVIFLKKIKDNHVLFTCSIFVDA
jgi:hypothetical protein